MTQNELRHREVSFRRKDGTSLAVQCLRLHASNAGDAGSIPGWGTKIPHPAWHGQKKKKKKSYHLNKDNLKINKIKGKTTDEIKE